MHILQCKLPDFLVLHLFAIKISIHCMLPDIVEFFGPLAIAAQH